jgi:hypothetical protein
MSRKSVSDEAKAVVRRSIEEVQGKGRFDVFEELFAHDFVDHTTQPGVLVQREMESGRSLLASIQPFLGASLDDTAQCNRRASLAAETATGFKRKSGSWCPRIMPH